MAAVDRAKQLQAKSAEQEAALADTARLREELGRVQQQLGALHGTCSALKSQLKAAKEQRQEAASAREHLLAAQVGAGVVFGCTCRQLVGERQACAWQFGSGRCWLPPSSLQHGCDSCCSRGQRSAFHAA